MWQWKVRESIRNLFGTYWRLGSFNWFWRMPKGSKCSWTKDRCQKCRMDSLASSKWFIEGSFVPPVEIRDLRDLTGYRKKLLQDTTEVKNRIHKVLQDANIKITTYISDVVGVSGRNIMESLVRKQVINLEGKVTL